jgi:uncharacterized protein DUF4349
MPRNRSKIVVALTATAVLVIGVAAGRHLLANGPGSSTSNGAAVPATSGTSVRSQASAPAHTPSGFQTVGGSVDNPASASGVPTAASGLSGTTGRSAATGTSGQTVLPVSAVTPSVIHTATIDLRVGKGELDSVLRRIAADSGLDGGYVNSSSVSGGTQRRAPVAGAIEIRVLDTDFNDAVAKLAGLGTVEDEQIKGKDVTVQVAQNEAAIYVLQDEVNLLQTKLSQATDLGTFLQIEAQLVPVEQQLRQLQSAENVLENSAALATITVHLTAPGGPVIPSPTTGPNADAATTAWRYLRHNSLAVLDGLAVAGGWALPVLIPLGLVGLIVLRVVRRRRHVVTPA